MTSSSISSAARVLFRDATRSIQQNRSTSFANRNFNSIRRTTCNINRTIPRYSSVNEGCIIQSCNDNIKQFSTAAQQEVEDTSRIAYDTFMEMIESEDLTPNHVSYSTFLRAISKLIPENGFLSISIVYSRWNA